MMRRVPIRLRLTLIFAAAAALMLLALALVLHARFRSDLTRSIDMELRSRAQVIVAAVAGQDPALAAAGGGGGDLIDPDEAFAQVLTQTGRIVESSRGVALAPMLSTGELRRVMGRTVLYTTRVRGVDDPVRLLATSTGPAARPLFLVVGSTLGDRNEALGRLTLLLAVFGGIVLAMVSIGGWLVAGAALRPVERMRREASAISEADLDRRLELPPANDELARLGATLNSLLARLEEAFRRKGEFLDQASHELRTPLAVLKMELDLAATDGASREELVRALRNASGEADRLTLLAEDLLVLARVRDGKLPVRRVPTDLSDLIGSICTAHGTRATALGSSLTWHAPAAIVAVDPSRVRQAVEDILDNAIRYGRGRPTDLRAEVDADVVRITVRDKGPGFDATMLSSGMEPFEHRATNDVGGRSDGSGGAGLGLAIARAVAEAHGGSLILANAPTGGAAVTLTMRTVRDALPDVEPGVGDARIEQRPPAGRS